MGATPSHDEDLDKDLDKEQTGEDEEVKVLSLVFSVLNMCQNSEGWSCGAGNGGHVIKTCFNLCVAPSYRNRSILLFQKAGVKGCPE